MARNSADTSPDFNGKVSGSSHNLIGNADGSSGFSAGNGDLLGSTAHPLGPRLGTLADNGGPTRTLALLPGSPAINAGNGIAEAATGPFDQRGQGFSRVAGGNNDIGAFEVQSPPPSPPSARKSSSPPCLFQAWLALDLDGIELAAVLQSGAAAFYDNFATASTLWGLLQFFGNPDLDTIQSNIAFNEPYAGPFGPYLVLAGEIAVLQAIQPS